MTENDICLAYECPVDQVDPALIQVCDQLGDHCESCPQRLE